MQYDKILLKKADVTLRFWRPGASLGISPTPSLYDPIRYTASAASLAIYWFGFRADLMAPGPGETASMTSEASSSQIPNHNIGPSFLKMR